MEIDLSGAGSGFTAVGMIFGTIHTVGPQPGSFRGIGPRGNDVFTSGCVGCAKNLGQGLIHSFFGVVISGDEIARIIFETPGSVEGIDDFWFGAANPASLPEPSTLLLLASGLAGLAAWRRKKAA